jgi:YD repeat-containing protein
MIPVAGGPPIEIHRTHSQLTADLSGDFGNGWQFCTASPDLRESVARTPFENLLGQFAALPFREGDRVQITTPDCQRVGFTSSPVPHTGVWSLLSDDFYDPRWILDPGVDWRLYGENDFTRLTGTASGQFDLKGLPIPLFRFGDGQYIIAAVNAAYNPLGYQLINKQGVRYHYDQETGLTDVTDRNGNTLNYTANGITSSSGQQVQFQRDAVGRITKVIDPDGNEIDYTYDAAGNLIDVQYPNGLSNS